MRQKVWIINYLAVVFLLFPIILKAQEGLTDYFPIEESYLSLRRPAQPGTPFDKMGRRFAFAGEEGGTIEAWAYPLKLVRNFSFSFFIKESTRPLPAGDLVNSIAVSPEATILIFTYQSFTVKAIYIVPQDKPAGLILLEVDSTEPLTIVCSFLPILQPMWPAGLGGQFSYWDGDLKAYVISEPTRKNHGLVGSPAASGISYTPAHMLSDTPNEFKIEVNNPEKAAGKYIPIVIAGGKGSREEIRNIYLDVLNRPKEIYEKNREHFRRLIDETLGINTPNKELDLAFQWAKISLDNLLVDNPDLGLGLVAGWGASGTSGRPGFGWFFGGDAYINSLSINSYGDFQTSRQTILFTKQRQREDGKMFHELSQAAGYINWWKDYPYGFIHGDTTPYYLVAVHDYVVLSGDLNFLQTNWSSIKKAFSWCLSTDIDSDGLMDNRRAGLGALEYGALTGIQTDIYLASIWIKAAQAMEYMANLAGDKETEAVAEKTAAKALETFNQRFWDEKNTFYSYAFNEKGELVKEISPWNALGMMWKLGSPERRASSLKKLVSSRLLTDWGIRSISQDSSYFEPLNYNYGAVWPFLNSWVTAALYKNRLPLQAYSLLVQTADHTFHCGLGTIGEVFSGSHNICLQESVAHQGFSSAAVVFPLVRGLLGLEGDAFQKKIDFSPNFPPDWKQVKIDNFKVGKAIFDFQYFRNDEIIIFEIKNENAEEFLLTLSPSLSKGIEIKSIEVDGIPVEFLLKQEGQVIFPELEIPLKKNKMKVKIFLEPTVEILPYVYKSLQGDRNTGLKIISVRREQKELMIEVEGLEGKSYCLDLLHSEMIEALEGAEIKGNSLFFRIPGDSWHKFNKKTIAVKCKR